ncbi:MAG: ankyrin repeat domain-containing protein [Gemmatimonadaceae bacterium]
MKTRRAFPAALLLSVTVLFSAAAPAPPESPVADAAMRRDSAKVRLLLKQGADVNAAQGDGMTALHWASVLGETATARMLVYAGARLEAATRNGNYTPLHLASRSGKVSVVRALLEAGANVNAATTSGGATALHLAASQGSVETIAALLDKGAAVNATEGAWGQTPLMWAAAYNRVQAIEALVARGADIKGTSKVEDVPARERADRAANQLRQRRVAALKAAEQPPRPAGAVVAQASGPAGPNAQTPGARRDSAAARTRMASAPDAGSRPANTRADSTAGVARPAMSADSTAARATANTPADSADERRLGAVPGGARPAGAGDSTSAARGGLGYGDLVGNKGGLTPLLFAARQGHIESVEALLAAGADVNQVSAGDHTSPLLMAVINGHFDLAKKLLTRGASPKLASDAGATPLYATINVQWAAKSLYPQPTAQKQQETTYLQLMEMLVKAGADVNARLTKHLWYMSFNFDLLGVNTTGATPFWRAAYGTDVPAMKLLIAHGADPKIATIKPAGRQRGDDAPVEDDGAPAKDPSGLPPIPAGGPGVYPIHAASGVGYGEGYAANSHMHAPDGWLPAVKYLIEELGLDVNARDHNGYNPIHHAAARGDNALIDYLMSKGGDVMAVSRRGQTTADMANGPVQRIPPFLETVAHLEKLGAKNSHKCRSC